MNNYKILQKLGDGTFGNVFMALDLSSNQLCAIKTFKNQINEKKCPELHILKKLDHINIVKIIAEIKERRTFSIVLEYAEKSLLQLYTQVKEQKRQLPEQQIKSIIYQIASGLDYLHQQGFFHRDLKPENVLICDNGLIKIVDFGQVQAVQNNNQYIEYVSTRWYRAPEQLLNTGYGKEIDIWALGCIMGELFALTPIFPGTSEIDQLSRIQNIFGNIEFQWQEASVNLLTRGAQLNTKQSESNIFFSNLPHLARDLIKRMLTYDPKQRITGEDILKHEWFKERYQFLPSILVQQQLFSNQYEIEQSPLIIKKEKEEQKEQKKVKEIPTKIADEDDDLFSDYVPSGMQEIKSKPKRLLRNDQSASNFQVKTQVISNFKSASKPNELYLPGQLDIKPLQQFTITHDDDDKQNPAFFSKPLKLRTKN